MVRESVKVTLFYEVQKPLPITYSDETGIMSQV